MPALQPRVVERNLFVAVGLIGRIVYLIIHLSSHILACKVLIYKGEARQTVAIDAFGQVAIEVDRTVAEWQRNRSFVTLACTVCHGGTDIIGIVTWQVVLSFGKMQGNPNDEAAGLVGHQCIFFNRDLALVAPTPPIPIGSAHHRAYDLCTLHGHACIALGRAFHADGIAILVALRIGCEVHGERGPLVFLNMEACFEVVVSFDGEQARLARLRKVEHDAGRSILVRAHLLRLRFLVIGIVERQRDAVIGIDGGLLRAVVDGEVYHAHAHLLTGTIEAAVGKELHLTRDEVLLVFLPIVVARCIIGRAAARRTEVISSREGLAIHIVFLLTPLVAGLALAVNRQRGLQAAFTFLISAREDAYLGVRNGLSRSGAHGDEPHPVVGKPTLQHIHVRHVEQHAHGANVLIVGCELNEINALFQRPHRH